MPASNQLSHVAFTILNFTSVHLAERTITINSPPFCLVRGVDLPSFCGLIPRAVPQLQSGHQEYPPPPPRSRSQETEVRSMVG